MCCEGTTLPPLQDEGALDRSDAPDPAGQQHHQQDEDRVQKLHHRYKECENDVDEDEGGDGFCV